MFIILIAFMSAIYSHRKQMGYSYDETVGYSTQTDDSSDENVPLDPELQKLNIKSDNSSMISSVEQVMEVSQQGYDNFSVIDRKSDEQKLCDENHDEYEMIDFESFGKKMRKKNQGKTHRLLEVIDYWRTNYSFIKLGKYKQFFKRHEEKQFNKGRSSKRRRLKKLRTDKISMLFLKKFSQLFPSNETKSRKASIDNDCDTEMITNSQLFNSEYKFHSKPLVLDENEL